MYPSEMKWTSRLAPVAGDFRIRGVRGDPHFVPPADPPQNPPENGASSYIARPFKIRDFMAAELVTNERLNISRCNTAFPYHDVLRFLGLEKTVV